MKKVILGVGAAGLLLLCVGMWFLNSGGSTGSDYYAQIDNDCLQEGGPRQGVVDFQGGMDYYYTLPAYTEDGKEKELTFGVSRELTDGAFVRLEVLPLRGVVSWAEAQYDQLPPAVQSHYTAPADPPA